MIRAFFMQHGLEGFHVQRLAVADDTVHIKNDRSEHRLSHQRPETVREIGRDGIHAACHHPLHFIFGVGGPHAYGKPRFMSGRHTSCGHTCFLRAKRLRSNHLRLGDARLVAFFGIQKPRRHAP